MPAAIPPAGGGGLPSLSARAFQLIDQGFGAFDAAWIAFSEYLNALVRWFGGEVVADIGEIGQ